MKKVLSLVLVLAMVLSSMSFAFAGTFTDVVDSDYEDAINTLVALGIVDGYEDGTFRLEKTVTRAEMAKLMVVTLGYGDLVAGSKSNFADTQGHWADAYIALAAGKGIVVGTGDGKFTPDRTVSYDEAITMVVRALGYTDSCNELKNMTWPTNFKVKAAELDITDDVVMTTTGADRGGVAQLISNTLEATLVSVNSDGDVVQATTQTTSSAGAVVVKYSKLLSRIATLETITVADDTLDPDAKDYAGSIVNLAPYMYQELEVYTIDDDVVYVDDVKSVVVSGTIVDVLDKTGKSLDDAVAGFAIAAGDTVKIVIADANDKEYKVSVKDNVVAYYNNEEETIEVENFANLLFNNSAATVTAVVDDATKTNGGNDNGKVDNGEFASNLVVMKATKGILVKTDYAEGKTKIAGESANILLPLDDGDVDLTNIFVEGAVDSLEDIQADDVVIAYEALNYSSADAYPVVLEVVRDSIEGTVTKTNSTAKTIYIDGTSYKKSSVTGAIAANAVAVNDDGVFYLDNAGKIFAIDTDTELVDYAVVIGASNGDTSTKFTETDVDDYAELKLATSQNETAVYKIYTTFDNNVIDDVATLDKTGNLVTLSGAVLTVDVKMVKGQLVKYSLDEDGYIDAIEVVATTPETIDTDDLDVMTVDATVVFDATDDYGVVATSNLKDGKSHQVAYFASGSNKGKISVIISSQVESVNDGVYGVIQSLNYVQNTSGSKVVEVTALVNGEEVKFLTAKGKSTSQFACTTTSAAFRFEFNSSDVLLSVDNITAGVAATDDVNVDAFLDATITDLDNDGMKVNTVQKFFASDVAVYIYDQSDDKITIGDISDLLESSESNEVSTSAYVIDKTDSSRIGIVVQVVK